MKRCLYHFTYSLIGSKQTAFCKLVVYLIFFASIAGSGEVSAQNIDSLMTYYQQKANKYLVKEPDVRNHYRIDWQGVHIYASARNKLNHRAEFTVHWKDLENFKRLIKYADRSYQLEVYNSKGIKPFDPQEIQIINILAYNHQKLPVVASKPLAGIKIAIDPGHIAGDWETAVAEGRFIEIYGVKKDAIRFFEGELTLSTAIVLRDSLVKLGAEVMLTRDKPNFSAMDMSFDEWKQTELLDTLLRQGIPFAKAEDIAAHGSEQHLYKKYFLDADLDARAAKINYFKPNFTVIIHYNADVLNKNWVAPTHRNYSMIFVPGSYLSDEMNTSTERFDFLRTLLTDHLQESTLLSSFVMQGFESGLNVPAIKDYQAPYYIEKYSMKVQDGIYARNLRLCRLLNTPVCYGESLLQDNKKELLALSKNDFRNGVTAKRIVQVADAYLYGIKRYVALLKQRQ